MKRNQMKSLSSAIALSVALMAGSVVATELTVPNEFAADQPAIAANVNANFAAVKGAVDDNNARIAALEAQIAELQAVTPVSEGLTLEKLEGNYKMIMFETEFGAVDRDYNDYWWISGGGNQFDVVISGSSISGTNVRNRFDRIESNGEDGQEHLSGQDLEEPYSSEISNITANSFMFGGDITVFMDATASMGVFNNQWTGSEIFPDGDGDTVKWGGNGIGILVRQ